MEANRLSEASSEPRARLLIVRGVDHHRLSRLKATSERLIGIFKRLLCSPALYAPGPTESNGAVSENLKKTDAARIQPRAELFDGDSGDIFRRFKRAMALRQGDDEIALIAFATQFVLRRLHAKKRANRGEQFLGVNRLGQIKSAPPSSPVARS